MAGCRCAVIAPCVRPERSMEDCRQPRFIPSHGMPWMRCSISKQLEHHHKAAGRRVGLSTPLKSGVSDVIADAVADAGCVCKACGIVMRGFGKARFYGLILVRQFREPGLRTQISYFLLDNIIAGMAQFDIEATVPRRHPFCTCSTRTLRENGPVLRWDSTAYFDLLRSISVCMCIFS
jgi:hypothetical protein